MVGVDVKSAARSLHSFTGGKMSITRWFQIFFMFYYSNLARDDEI